MYPKTLLAQVVQGSNQATDILKQLGITHFQQKAGYVPLVVEVTPNDEIEAHSLAQQSQQLMSQLMGRPIEGCNPLIPHMVVARTIIQSNSFFDTGEDNLFLDKLALLYILKGEGYQIDACIEDLKAEIATEQQRNLDGMFKISYKSGPERWRKTQYLRFIDSVSDIATNADVINALARLSQTYVKLHHSFRERALRFSMRIIANVAVFFRFYELEVLALGKQQDIEKIWRNRHKLAQQSINPVWLDVLAFGELCLSADSETLDKLKRDLLEQCRRSLLYTKAL